MTENRQTGKNREWVDILRVATMLVGPPFIAGLVAPVFISVQPGGQLPTVIEWLGFVGILVAITVVLGVVVSRIGGEK